MLWCPEHSGIGAEGGSLLRKAAIGLAILAVVVVAALLLAPLLVDVNRLKPLLVAEVEARTGRTVEIAGSMDLSFLPSPIITARDIRVSGPSGPTSDMLRLRAFEVKLAFWPLLTGSLDVRSATLIEPELNLQRWPTAGGGAAAPPAAPSAGPGAASARGYGVIVAIDRVRIQNGAITYRTAEGVDRLEHINATATLASLAGPYQATGDLVSRGAAIGFETRVGRIGGADLPVQASVTTRPAARLDIDAVLSGTVDEPRIAGKLKLVSDDLQALSATLLRARLPAALARHVALAGDLSGSLSSIVVDHLGIDLGAAHGEGRLRVEAGRPPMLAVSLTVNSIDLDHWGAARKAAVWPLRAVGEAFAAESDRAPLAFPRGINASLDLGVEALLWHNDLIREARLKASLKDGRLTVEHLAGLLPGGSDVAGTGSAAIEADGVHAEGAFEANADDMRSLFAWFGVAVDAIPADRLRKATMSSRFTLLGDRLDFTRVDGTIDATRLSGAATILLRARPGLGIRLAADRLNIDAYLPRPGPSNAPSATPPPPRGTAPPRAALTMDAFDANFDARVQSLTWRGQPLGDVHLAGTLQSGDATVHELSIGDLGGAAIKLSGVLERTSGGVPKGQMAFDMQGPEFDRVLRVLSPDYATGVSYGPFSLGGGLQSDGTTLAMDSDLEMLDGHLHLAGDIAPLTRTLDLEVSLDHPSLARLVRVFDAGYHPAGGDPGALKLTAHVGGSGDKFSASPFALAVGAATLEGKLELGLAGPRPHIAAAVTIGDWAIDRLISARQSAAVERSLRRAGLRPGVILAQLGGEASTRWSTAPLKLQALRPIDFDLALTGHSLAYGAWRLEQPNITALLKDGTLELRRVAGTLFGGAIEASGTLARGPTPSLSGKIALLGADLKSALLDVAGASIVDGRFDIDGSFSASGATQAELVSHLTGDAQLRGRDGGISGIDLKATSERLNGVTRPADLITLLRGSFGGRTGFSQLSGSFHMQNGIAKSDNLRLILDGGEGRASATVDLPLWTLDSRIELKLADANAPPLVLRLEGPLDGPRRIFEVKALEDYLGKKLQEVPSRP